jgi:hypothetical protein
MWLLHLLPHLFFPVWLSSPGRRVEEWTHEMLQKGGPRTPHKEKFDEWGEHLVGLCFGVRRVFCYDDNFITEISFACRAFSVLRRQQELLLAQHFAQLLFIMSHSLLKTLMQMKYHYCSVQ